MQSIKRICVVIINYKTPELTLNCILSLKEQLDKINDCIVIVDNNSGGEDLTNITQGIEDNQLNDFTILLSSEKNNGFSSGNNLAIRSIPSKYYILTNADTLFRPGAVAALLQAAAEQPQAGLISPRLEWPDGEPQNSCFRFLSPLSEIINAADTSLITSLLKRFDTPLFTENQSTWPDWTSFACVLIRREVFSQIGMLDEGYFMYYEDVDFCRRARQQGLRVLNWPNAHVVHLRGQSSGVKKLQREKRRLPTYHYKSRARYYRKFYGPAGLLLSNICWLSGRAVSKLREVIMGKSRTVPVNQFYDIWKR